MKQQSMNNIHQAVNGGLVFPNYIRKKSALSLTWISLFALTFLVLIGIACQPKDGVQPGNYGNGPRKTVPTKLVGEWTYTSVSSSNIVSRNGHTVPAWSLGSVFHINADGTGWSIVTASTATYTSEDTQRVEENGTFEIDLDSDGEMVFRFYPANGKVYNNDVFAHDVEAAKLYPQTFTNWAGTLTNNGGRTCFESGELRYYKTN
ncbi:hypothetical protein IC229_20690 [Spirosoma sp. BT702]|uniref:Uncharacterized protein n=1 Tax=Spirosoma profusum TaxID=2771354 RepID=A0A927AU91_9BACT|nr:hypothetical protein [Spirosoma profusum]MBD2703077.1 hypothetical protein [Spirosoma profusum]